MKKRSETGNLHSLRWEMFSKKSGCFLWFLLSFTTEKGLLSGKKWQKSFSFLIAQVLMVIFFVSMTPLRESLWSILWSIWNQRNSASDLYFWYFVVNVVNPRKVFICKVKISGCQSWKISEIPSLSMHFQTDTACQSWNFWKRLSEKSSMFSNTFWTDTWLTHLTSKSDRCQS